MGLIDSESVSTYQKRLSVTRILHAADTEQVRLCLALLVLTRAMIRINSQVRGNLLCSRVASHREARPDALSMIDS
jgi:hypothetical protein